MAGELPTPLDMESSPAVPATAATNWSKWSTLPDDLVRRIAKCFLYTNDVDYYMCFRAVYPSWRAATGDPRRDTREPCFRCFQPLHWMVLDDDFHSDDKRVLVNTATGRIVRKKLLEFSLFWAAQ
ncbi:uncharacterized protein LOC119273253 isoform X2 [Triticum dicoccoides]|nr:uncharacterized protein LOC119273253 isoform X2 [Triticum dicoccoides]